MRLRSESFASALPGNNPAPTRNDLFGDIATRRFDYETLPTMVSAYVASATRAPTQTEINYSEHKKLHLLCHHPNLWSDIFAELDNLPAWQAAMEQTLDSPTMRNWAHSIDPKETHHSLDKFIFSEEDVADHAVTRALRPATKIIQVMAQWMHLHKDGPASTITLTSASADKEQTLPDRILRERIKELLDKIRAIFEFKTPNSLNRQSFAELFDCYEMMREEFGLNIPLPYWWMDEEVLKSKADKILCQLWCELQSFEVEYGLLSSFLSNMTVCRGNVMGRNCLYFSDVVLAEHLTLKHIVAVEAVSLGWITIPPPPQLPDDILNFVATYSDPMMLDQLLLCNREEPGWDARFSDMQRLRLAISRAPGNFGPSVKTPKPKRRAERSAVNNEDDDATPRQTRRDVPSRAKAPKPKSDTQRKRKLST